MLLLQSLGKVIMQVGFSAEPQAVMPGLLGQIRTGSPFIILFYLLLHCPLSLKSEGVNRNTCSNNMLRVISLTNVKLEVNIVSWYGSWFRVLQGLSTSTVSQVSVYLPHFAEVYLKFTYLEELWFAYRSVLQRESSNTGHAKYITKRRLNL